jgi:hypothetical protein
MFVYRDYDELMSVTVYTIRQLPSVLYGPATHPHYYPPQFGELFIIMTGSHNQGTFPSLSQ